MTKISIIASNLSASGAGRWGGGVRPFLLCQAWQTLGYTVEIVGFQFGDPASVPAPKNTEIKIVPGGKYPQVWKSIAQLLKIISGDLVCAYKLRPTSLGTALLWKLKHRKPAILDIDDWEMSWHGGDDYCYRPTPKQLARDILKSNGALRHPEHPFYLQQIEKWVKRADAVTVHSQFLQQRFGGTYVPNGKDTDLFDPGKYDRAASRQKYNLEDDFVLMFPGAPRPYKGVEDVLIALDRLGDPRMRLAIVGGSPYDDYDRELQEKWGRWLLKLPRQSYASMPEVVAAADAIVVPQRDEPATRAQFPLKITDGMSMAKPILATRVGDIPDILGDTGYLVDPGSPEQLAAQIVAIANDPELALERGRKARSRCIDRYSIAAMSAALARVMEQLKP